MGHPPSEFAFDFKKPFDAAGRACLLDRGAVKAKAEVNALAVSG